MKPFLSKICAYNAIMLIGTALLVGTSCAGKPQAAAIANSYRYRHLETTGITNELQLADGTIQPIMFAPESTKRELQALQTVLKCRIFGTLNREQTAHGNPLEQRLFLVGQLQPKVLRTPSGEGMATSEEYKLFVLRSWYLETPVSVVVSKVSDNPHGELDSPVQVKEHSTVPLICPDLVAFGNTERFVRSRSH
jgi:hypothetical protein